MAPIGLTASDTRDFSSATEKDKRRPESNSEKLQSQSIEKCWIGPNVVSLLRSLSTRLESPFELSALVSHLGDLLRSSSDQF